jgi:hypothetical protein
MTVITRKLVLVLLKVTLSSVIVCPNVKHLLHGLKEETEPDHLVLAMLIPLSDGRLPIKLTLIVE